jgi:hypothetical protein
MRSKLYNQSPKDRRHHHVDHHGTVGQFYKTNSTTTPAFSIATTTGTLQPAKPSNFRHGSPIVTA